MFWNRLFKPFDYTLNAALISDIGKKRVENQDNFCFDTFINMNKAKSVRLKSQNFALPEAYAIMDGMGGEKLGAQASLEAAGFFSNIKKNISELLQRLNADERERVFYSLIHSMNEKVCQMAIKNHVKQSGTTFCAIFLIENRAYIVSVGDSKIFLIRNGKAVWQNESDAINTAIVENGRKKWIKGGLSQFLGMDTKEYELIPHIKELNLKPDDKFLLCSDGLTDYVSPDEIGRTVKENLMENSMDILLNLALKRGGRDNITILRLDIKRKE
ncbi:protein phosphatase 2C [Lachnoanaerobaculum saburreum DSM 3986]|uniref:Protein phosphatase 2C n=2 Tax=Lachnoanaerobaculum saburreum TaxID=467210 RepID=E6LJL3_9FIRM|nr:protein phosphatase 2C [Lachnoanaerobaculum saburreum DSM 3986]